MRTIAGLMLVAGVLASATSQAETIRTPECDVSRAKAVIATDYVDRRISSDKFIDVPQASIRFLMRAPGCVIVQFSGANYGIIRAVLNETVVNDGGELAYNERIAMFVFSKVPAGVNTIVMQLKKNPDYPYPPGPVPLVARKMVVQFGP